MPNPASGILNEILLPRLSKSLYRPALSMMISFMPTSLISTSILLTPVLMGNHTSFLFSLI
jgi:hypothetical protein